MVAIALTVAVETLMAVLTGTVITSALNQELRVAIALTVAVETLMAALTGTVITPALNQELMDHAIRNVTPRDTSGLTTKAADLAMITAHRNSVPDLKELTSTNGVSVRAKVTTVRGTNREIHSERSETT